MLHTTTQKELGQRTLSVAQESISSALNSHLLTRPADLTRSTWILSGPAFAFDFSSEPFSSPRANSVTYLDNRSINERPARGTHVDSISYYTYDLADCNKHMYSMQQRKTEIAYSGNRTIEADTWLARLMISAYAAADQILVDSAEDNALRASHSIFEDGAGIPQAELMSSRYGSFGPLGVSPRGSQPEKFVGHDRLLLRSSSNEQLQLATRNSSSEVDIISEEIIFVSILHKKSSLVL